VPVAVKDNIDVEGLPTTAACPAFAYDPGKDATCVARLKQAGAIVIGKTNLDQFATGLVGVRSPYGTPRNLFDPGAHSRRIELGIGDRGRRRPRSARARHRHRRVRPRAGRD
jgi:Asp-tRNA(Asn)/Glu-tRNA(Gln) amidotransferase A subunit family amidase